MILEFPSPTIPSTTGVPEQDDGAASSLSPHLTSDLAYPDVSNAHQFLFHEWIIKPRPTGSGGHRLFLRLPIQLPKPITSNLHGPQDHRHDVARSLTLAVSPPQRGQSETENLKRDASGEVYIHGLLAPQGVKGDQAATYPTTAPHATHGSGPVMVFKVPMPAAVWECLRSATGPRTQTHLDGGPIPPDRALMQPLPTPLLTIIESSSHRHHPIYPAS